MAEQVKAPPAPLDLVEWRVQGSPSGSRAAFVAYLDAPTCADLLDEWVGPFNWRDDYQAIDAATMWCKLEVRSTGDDEWVAKKDVGVAATTEPAKSLVSDAFKRVAMRKWGVGRNVFNLPILWAPCDVRERNGKTNAYPNDQTVPDLQRQLLALGFTEAGEKVRVSGAAAEPVEEPDPREHDALLSEVDNRLVRVAELGIELDGGPDVVRDYAKKKVENARAALAKLDGRIAEHAAKAPADSEVPF